MTRLDALQRGAAALSLTPVRVIAGAGTGKTAVIAERFRRLVASGVDPSSIGFRIVSGAERWILARELMWELGDAALVGDERPDDLVAPALQMLERLKQELVPLRRLDEWADSADDPERAALMHACVRLFRAYELECRKRSLLDFDDLLERSVAMLSSDPRLAEAYRRRFPHVLVDEYQDLNLAQERLVELVSFGGAPFIVGDDDQSIYRFRGASRASLERFLDRFPNARSVALGKNQRSSARIVAAAAALIGNNSERLAKRIAWRRPLRSPPRRGVLPSQACPLRRLRCSAAPTRSRPQSRRPSRPRGFRMWSSVGTGSTTGRRAATSSRCCACCATPATRWPRSG